MRLEDLYPSAPHLRERLAERFWSKVDVRGEDECWEWQACRINNPRSGFYGRFGVAGHTEYAHRVAYLLTYGEIDDALFACHTCDNAPCCNPAHLFMGTGKDNAADRDTKGRYVLGRVDRGEDHASSKLDNEQVRSIKRALANGEATRRELAELHGVHIETIRAIATGRTWKEVA